MDIHMIISLITMLVAHLTNGMQLYHGEIAILNKFRDKYVSQICYTPG